MHSFQVNQQPINWNIITQWVKEDADQGSETFQQYVALSSTATTIPLELQSCTLSILIYVDHYNAFKYQ